MFDLLGAIDGHGVLLQLEVSSCGNTLVRVFVNTTPTASYVSTRWLG